MARTIRISTPLPTPTHRRRRSSAGNATLERPTKPTTPTISQRSSSRPGLMDRGERFLSPFFADRQGEDAIETDIPDQPVARRVAFEGLRPSGIARAHSGRTAHFPGGVRHAV